MQTGDQVGAERLCREAVDSGDPGAFAELATWLDNAGDPASAERLRRHGLTDEGTISEPWD
jgi:hypothetical protein